MVIAAIVLLILAIVCGIVASNSNDGEGWMFGAFFLAVFALLVGIFSTHGNLSSQQLTGYIYSSETNFAGYTTAHIRFSENAGADSQPEFCVKADSEAGRAIKQYTGSSKKVQVDIPAYFYFSNDPFVCGTTDMTIKETK